MAPYTCKSINVILLFFICLISFENDMEKNCVDYFFLRYLSAI